MLGRFTQPDTIIPEVFDPQSLNRFSYVENRPVSFDDPDGQCFPECLAFFGPEVIVAVALIAAVAYVGSIANSMGTTDPEVIGDRIISDFQRWEASRAISQTSQAERWQQDSSALQVKVKKPLTPDEQDKVSDLMGTKTEEFLKKHPDLASEALKKLGGAIPEKGKDHPGEAQTWLNGLEKKMKELAGVRDIRNEDAQSAIDRAIEAGKKWAEVLKRKLRGEE